MIFSVKKKVDCFLQCRPVIGEVPAYAHSAIGIGDDGDEVGPFHLRLDEGLSGAERPKPIKLGHGAHIKVEAQQPPVLVTGIARSRRCDPGL